MGAAAAAGGALATRTAAGAAGETAGLAARKPATVRGAFVYPPSEKLHKVGYYSWPGSTFDAEGRQRQYMAKIREMERDLGIRIVMDEKPLDEEADVKKFIADIQQSKPDGLLLIPFKKGHWGHVVRIVEETKTPTVILATLGVLLIPHVRQLHESTGVYMISAQDDLDSVARGMKMVRTAARMRQSRIINITGNAVREQTVPVIGTGVRTVPHERFYAAYRNTPATEEVKKLAKKYLTAARKMVEPNEGDVLDAAKTYFIFKDLLAAEQGHAVMMNCLPGLQRPHKHVPPCMGFMSLRDEGVAMGCESDLDATLTMMLLQELFDMPGFQHNPAVDTEKNHYFGAHCTSASKMRGVDAPSEPYVLRSHAEAGWGCVPRVLLSAGQEVTIAKYLSVRGEGKPRMIVYSGTIIGCPPIPPTGGCRTNVEATLNELDDVCDLQGHHLTLIYGNHAKELRTFCRLYDIELVV
jgi:hypothetical protein